MLVEALVLSVALAMDATAVAAARSVAGVPRGQLVTLAILFAVFQAGMAGLGVVLGKTAATWIERYGTWIAFVLLVGIGVKMIYEAVRGGDDDESPSITPGGMIVLAIATSLDALAAGVTLPVLAAPIAVSLAMIGIATLVLSLVGGIAGAKLGQHVGNKLEIVGGLALIAIGIKTVVA
ncbi:MAG TPA: manganese efflux pump MntP family protein [Kofleriaceae bacterium]